MLGRIFHIRSGEVGFVQFGLHSQSDTGWTALNDWHDELGIANQYPRNF
jgi:hypothetical protein